MAVLLNREIKEVWGEAFYDVSLPESFRKAKKFAGEKGFVATFPDLVCGRIVAPTEDEVWGEWHTPNSEELVGTTLQGNRVFIENHDITILTPERIEQAYQDGLTLQCTAKLTDKEVHDLLAGKIKPIFSFDELKKQNVLPRSYAVIIDFDLAERTLSDYQDADRLLENPIFVARAGTVEQAAAYIKKAKIVCQTDTLPNWHKLNSIDPKQPQGYVTYLTDNDYSTGFSDYDLGYDGRPVGVAPDALVVCAKNIVSPSLEQILKGAKQFVPEAVWGDFSSAMRAIYK